MDEVWAAAAWWQVFAMRYDGSSVKQWAGASQWRAFQADYARFRQNGLSGWGSEGMWALALYRFQRTVQHLEPRWLWVPVRISLTVVKKLLTMLITIDLDPRASIGPGLFIPHGGQIRVHGGATIGADCALAHLCTIGAGPSSGIAMIGDHVLIGCHASIIGAVKIGDYATIGSNSLVVDDVPAGAAAIGVPARSLPGFRRRADLAEPAATTGLQLGPRER
jgi:serine O-acetyltransferase